MGSEMTAKATEVADQIDALLSMKNVTPRIPNLARQLMRDAEALLRASAEREKGLREALAVFAKFADQYDEDARKRKEYGLIGRPDFPDTITLAHLYYARAAISKATGEPR